MIRLALRLGRTPRELLESVTSEELTELAGFDRIDPIGDWRGDLGAAGVQATLANINRKEGAKPFATSDFMPDFEHAAFPPEPAIPDNSVVSAQVRMVLAPFMKKG